MSPVEQAVRRVRTWDVGTDFVAAYLGAVTLVVVLQHAAGLPDATALAASPAKLAAGRVWTLLTSGLVVDGDAAPQLVATTALAVAAVHFRGAKVFWAAALGGHIGSTLIAYAGVGAAWLVDPASVAGVVHAPDYGISCVWAAALGASAAGSFLARRRHWPWIVASSASVLVAVTAFSEGIATVEHVLAWLIGAAVVVVATRRYAARS